MNDTTDTHTMPHTEDAAITVLLMDESGNAVPGQGAPLDPEELKEGHILTLGSGKDKRHWRILGVDQAGADEAATIRVSVAPAVSTLKWTLLLLAILAGTWFLIDWAITFFIG